MKLDDMIAAERSAPARATEAQTNEVWKSIESTFVSVAPMAGMPLATAKASSVSLAKIGAALSSTAGKVMLAATLVTGGVVGATRLADEDSDTKTAERRVVRADGPAASTAMASPNAPQPRPQVETEAAPLPASVVSAPPTPPVEQTTATAPAAPQTDTARQADAAPTKTRRRPSPVDPVEKSQASFQDELALIQETQSALRRGAHRRALTLARQHAKQYPKGAFVEDREALRTLALCKSSNTKASSSASRFLELCPPSMHKTRIVPACE